MFPFRKKPSVSFRRPQRDGFRLETGDVEEGTSFWARALGLRGERRGGFSRYIAAGGTRDTRQEGEEAAETRSWRRFAWAFCAFVLLWLLGYFL